MLRWRLLLGTLIIAVLIGLCWLDCGATVLGIWLLPVAIAAALLATKEMLDLLAAAGMKPARWLVYLGNFVVVVGAWIVQVWAVQSGRPTGYSLSTPPRPCAWLLLTSPAATVFAFVFAMFFVEMLRYRQPGGVTANVAGVLAFLYIGITLQYALLLRLWFGVGVLATWILVVKMGDTVAYTFGLAIRTPEAVPLISPGKTVESRFAAGCCRRASPPGSRFNG